MASNTTNLINININNGGGLTAVATGENHLIQNNGNYLSATPTNTLPRRGTLVNNNEQLNLSNYQVGNNCSNQDLAAGTTSNRDGQCTLQNCDLNPNNCSLIRSSSSLSSNGGGCYATTPSSMKNHQHIQTSNQNLAQILANNQSSQHMYDQFIDCMGAGGGNGTILPPPLFDNGCNNFSQCYEMPGNNYCTMSSIDLPKTPSSSGGSKRLHRTIPKHFTMSSPSTTAIVPTGGPYQQTTAQTQPTRNGAAEQKKPTCQCPVQHVPMNYMNSMQYNQPPSQQPESQPAQAIQVAQNAQYSQPSHQRYHNYSNNKKNNVSKSTTFPSNMNASSGSHKIQTITAEMLNCSGNDGQTQSQHNDLTTSINGGGTLRRSHHKSSIVNSGSHGTPNKKIATISAATPSNPSVPATTYISNKSDNKHHGHHQQSQQIHSILKNKNHGECPDPVCSEPNPILPPKMYKNSNRYSCGSAPAQSSTKIHTITRPNDLQTIASSSHFSLLAITNNPKLIHHQQQQQAAAFHQPTLLRTNLQFYLIQLEKSVLQSNIFAGNTLQHKIIASRWSCCFNQQY